MSTQLTEDERERYTRIIDDLIHKADLETVTQLIEARFDAISGVQQQPTPEEANGAGSPESASANGDGEPTAKKRKRETSSIEDADARLAAELQAQENSLARQRVTRGANKAKGKAANSKAADKGKKGKAKKSAKRVRDEDDSEAGSGDDGEKPKRKAGGGFQKPFNLSYPLQELTGETQLSRPQVVKKLWDYIKEKDLQDPNDKRQIICDSKLQAIFKQEKINMFSMNKLLGNQLYPIDE
ncbi:uncharacterized protein CTHT_0000310 [Thermochaetoides thermophila DSM 1495]|uniref:DM2 domain-containing protein n=1 Tax=Chaetomium thermophilum (strain DSM 1495 / CBS 144.50 / IMI 039719) TaxID=759272 RepID=G0RXT4_CHATD|nr:hypothetical protein CTHT_0000310 [Thermochaetoides thermophila DSM 1495]EGS24100.1 hypothetical protein CTHT_0000310 [Thermochaetoides thermophila DSM 1495]